VTAVIDVDAVSVCYRLPKRRIPSLKEYALHWVRGALTYEKLWALKEVSFKVNPGEAVGIIGRNGAGKSTLLKVISRVLKPTSGRVRVSGVVAPILELGTGFDVELTGRENIYLNALLQGRSTREIDEKLDEIVAFSGLGEFIETPVRNYSSGMVARLGFAIVTAWIPTILVLDEFLTVGDTHFVKRCEERLRCFHDAGTTLVLVSHAPGPIRENCSRCIWLEQGQIVAEGAAGPVLDRYLEAHAPTEIRPAAV
jgi:ABC-type polysaccharide/polyol phosphate transport system ATPase subunit